VANITIYGIPEHAYKNTKQEKLCLTTHVTQKKKRIIFLTFFVKKGAPPHRQKVRPKNFNIQHTLFH